MLSNAPNAYPQDYVQEKSAASNGPLTPSLTHLNDRIAQMNCTVSEALHRLRGASPNASTIGGPEQKLEPNVSSLVMSCHAGAGRLANLLDELNNLI